MAGSADTVGATGDMEGPLPYRIGSPMPRSLATDDPETAWIFLLKPDVILRIEEPWMRPSVLMPIEQTMTFVRER